MTELAAAPVDGLDAIYTAKLWSLVPEVYRAQDAVTSDASSSDGAGPLQELLARISVQVAAVRRSIDRLWEDQSIESCDSWVIPYIAALLDTNLVPAMDSRQQRLDVANTIYYRRRKGTVALLEQLAADVTGYECHVVEFFRRLGRSRHSLDPAVGAPAQTADPAGARRLQRAEGLVGLLTGTPAGGYADLRNRLGATATGTAYDEYHHTVDVRLAGGALGWYGIPKVGFFLGRVAPFAVDKATPVPVTGCDGYFTFDPTGRQIPLFQRGDRGPNDYGENWRSLAAWQLPAPLTDQMWAALAAVGTPTPQAYPDPDAAVWPASLSVSSLGAGPLPLDQVRVWPEVGRFAVEAAGDAIEVGYHYGLFGEVGAGPFPRRRLGSAPTVYPMPLLTDQGETPTSLADALTALGGTGTVVIDDGLTRTGVAPVGSPGAPIGAVAVCAGDENRAVIRTAAGADPWMFQGAATADHNPSVLRLEGILFSGTDIVLRGTFDEVVLNCATIDPGTAGNLRTPATPWDVSVDERPLAPSRIWVEGTVRSLVLDRCILGPVRTRRGGVIETLTGTDSILQGLPTALGSELTTESVFDDDTLFSALKYQRDPLSQWLATQLGAASTGAVTAHVDATAVPPADLAAVVADLAAVIAGPLVWTAKRFADRGLRTSTQAAVTAPPADPAALALLNRQLMAEAYPAALADAALTTGQGLVDLQRCTVLGAGYVHRLLCSESILDDVVRVIDAQDGCVRFSAWSTDSALPRRYESVQVPAGSPIFVSRRFGEWGYGLVDDGADTAIVAATTAADPSILTGSYDGSEMGAFCAADAAIKDRSLRIKLSEYMPVGLSAVLQHMPVPDPDGESMRGRPWPT
ncbi:phage tail protein [Mycobacterium sp.]|uniref:phage tail protein n=1 Tax=Mycobacterium sp. TaxID=1785 RepID=UPI003D1028DE